MSKSNLDFTLAVCRRISGGNPDALNVCARVLKEGPQIDPDDAFTGIGCLLDLDSLGVYGSRIWMLYKDVCGENLAVFIAICRGWQLGFLNKETLLYAIDHNGVGLDVEDICAKVTERLPNFNLTPGVPPSPENEEDPGIITRRE